MTQLTPIASSNNPFYFKDGSCLASASVAWESWGKLSSRRDNAILLFPVLTTSHHAAGFDDQGPGVDWWTSECHTGWWDGFIGPGQALDTNDWYVLCPSFLGSCYGSTGPASLNPTTGKLWGASFPFPHVSDLVDASVRLLDYLGIGSLHSLVGASFGGYLALDFALRYPDRTEQVVSIASGLRVTPAMKLANFQQVMAIESHLAHDLNDIEQVQCACKGLMLARMIAMQQYIVPDEIDTYCDSRINYNLKTTGHFPLNHPLESWLLYQGKKFSERFDAHSYLRLLHAWQSWKLGFQGPSQQAQRCFAPCRHQSWLVLSIDSDMCFLPQEQTNLVATLAHADVPFRFVQVSSRLGHDSFIQEPALYEKELQMFLAASKSKLTVPLSS